jgi:hypothetical protein
MHVEQGSENIEQDRADAHFSSLSVLVHANGRLSILAIAPPLASAGASPTPAREAAGIGECGPAQKQEGPHARP